MTPPPVTRGEAAILALAALGIFVMLYVNRAIWWPHHLPR